jgi:hypothetical protein
MRDLNTEELSHVYGAGGCGAHDPRKNPHKTTTKKRRKTTTKRRRKTTTKKRY